MRVCLYACIYRSAERREGWAFRSDKKKTAGRKARNECVLCSACGTREGERSLLVPTHRPNEPRYTPWYDVPGMYLLCTLKRTHSMMGGCTSLLSFFTICRGTTSGKTFHGIFHSIPPDPLRTFTAYHGTLLRNPKPNPNPNLGAVNFRVPWGWP